MTQTQQRMNQKVCFIAGAGHSGSTLLGLVLGSHSDCFYAGEAEKTEHLGDEKTPEIKRVCKICGLDCPIWQNFAVPRAGDLYEAISAQTRKPIVVDSTKHTRWLSKQIDILRSTTAEPFLIFLHRDGRAVVNSWIRKNPTEDVAELIAGWIRQIQRTRALFEGFDGKKTKVRYEELATEPARVTRELCAFLGIDYQPAMLDFFHHEHHPLGGNNGTQFLVAKAQSERIKNPYARLSDRNRTYYQDHPLAICIDLRWKQELSPAVERLFEEMAGHENAEFEWRA